MFEIQSINAYFNALFQLQSYECFNEQKYKVVYASMSIGILPNIPHFELLHLQSLSGRE